MEERDVLEISRQILEQSRRGSYFSGKNNPSIRFVLQHVLDMYASIISENNANKNTSFKISFKSM